MRRGIDEAGSEQGLMAQARAGDEAAFAELWRKSYPGAVSTARALGAASPEDVVSEVTTKTFAAMRQGGGPSQDFTAYLYQAVRNLVRAPSVYRRETLPDETMPIVLAPDDVEEAVLTKLEHERIGRVLVAMPAREARLLVATELEGVSVNQVALDEGITPNYASVILKRARRSFQRLWYQDHLNDKAGRDPECAWVLNRAGAYLAGTLLGSAKTMAQDHLRRCPSCRMALSEAKTSSRRWGRVLGAGAGLLPTGLATMAWAKPVAASLAIAIGLVCIALALRPTPPPAPSLQATSQAAPTARVMTKMPSPAHQSVAGLSSAEPSSAKSAGIFEPLSTTTPAAPAGHPTGPAPQVVASPITAALADNSGGLCYPALSGQAQPGARLSVGGLIGATTTTVDINGRWVAVLVFMRPGSAPVSIAYVDLPDPALATPSPISFGVSLAAPPNLSVTQTADGVLVAAGGRPDAQVEVLMGGQSAGELTLSPDGRAQAEFPSPGAGPLTVGVRYAPPGCVGPVNGLTITLV